jgi:hypothetical protein
VVIGTESWLKKWIENKEIFPEGFNIFRRDREEKVGGESSYV